jgi:phosphate transport system substrate-binding protein
MLLALGLLLVGAPAAMAETPTHSGVTVTGAGATFPLNMIEQWKSDFNKSTGATIAYTGVGSGGGRQQLIAGTVDFAGSDVAAAANEVDQLKAKYGDFVYIPETSGAVAVLFKVPGLTSLKLTGPTLAKIFAGGITNWNDAAIAADNGAPGPNLPIQVFVRSDKSGTSGVFTEYLSKAGAPNWTAGITQTFPTDKGQIGKAGSDGVANAVNASSGGIGYAEHSFAAERAIPEVLVKNGGGQFRAPDAASVTAAIDDATLNPDGTLGLNFTTTKPDAYPISTVSYLLVPTKMDGDKGDNLKAFISYALSDAGQAKATPLGYSPLPPKVRTMAQAQLAKVNPVSATAAPAPTPAPAPAPAPVAAPAPAPKPAPKPAAAAAPKPAATQSSVAAQTQDPALASTGAGTTLALALAGLMLVAGGFAFGAGRPRGATVRS